MHAFNTVSCFSKTQCSNAAVLSIYICFFKYTKVLKFTLYTNLAGTQSRPVVFPAGIYLLKVNNRNTRTGCEICSKLTIKTPERRHHWTPFTYYTLGTDTTASVTRNTHIKKSCKDSRRKVRSRKQRIEKALETAASQV